MTLTRHPLLRISLFSFLTFFILMGGLIPSLTPVSNSSKMEESNAPGQIYDNIPPRTTPLRTSTQSFTKYDRQGAYGYAYNWWDGANTAHYNDYSGVDCANYVSQCLIAGGLSLHNGTDGNGYGVYPDTDRTLVSSYGAIVYCDYLNTHLRNYQNTNVTFVNEGSAYIPEEITIGDVVIFGDDPGDNWEHAMVVVWDNGTYDIGLAGHSSQVWNRSFWTEIGYSAFDCATFYHIKDTPVELFQFKVDTASLNVRVGPGKNTLDQNYQDIGDIHDGEEYIAYETEKDENGNTWWHFWFDDRAAWTAAWYTVNVTGNRQIEIDVIDHLNVQDGPGTGYSIYGQVYNGMRFVSDMSDGSWYRFWYGGAQKYSHGGSIDEIPVYTKNFTKPVIGFLPYWVSDNLNYSVISHLAWFSVELNSDGTIGNARGWPEWDVVNAVHDEGNKIILTATCFSSADIHTLLTSYKQATADNLLAQVQAGNADGICIDFEHPRNTADRSLLVQFMDILHDTFKAARNDYHVSLCTPSVDWWGTYDYGSLDEHVDAFMLMGYGYYYSGSDYAGPTSPLEGGSYYINKSVNDHLTKGASKSKLVLGLPFYGYDWPVSSTAKNAATTGSGSSRTYSAVQSLIATHSPTIYYDDTAECAWFNYNDGGLRQLWFDNYTSLERKFDYINDRDLGGLGIWAYGYQGIYNELEQLIHDKFIKNASSLVPPGSFTLFEDADDPDTDGMFNLNWSISNGADTYSVYVSSSPMSTPGSGTMVISGLTTNSTVITNQLSGSYYFSVVANNASGSTISNNVEVSVSLSLFLSSDAGNPDRDGTFTLNWSDSLGYDNYSLYSYVHPITEINGTLTNLEVGLTNSSYLITGIVNNTKIYYAILGFTPSGNASSNSLEVLVNFGIPGEFILHSSADNPDQNGEFYLLWTNPDGANNFTIYKFMFPITEINESLTMVDSQIPNFHCFITGLPNGTYYFIIIAFNNFGNSSSNYLKVTVGILPAIPSITGTTTTPNDGSDLLAFLTSPVGIASILSSIGFILGVGIIMIKRGSHKSTLKEREKLDKISQHVKAKQKYKKK